jgi:peptide-methionine (S)-S-oxide reductase
MKTETAYFAAGCFWGVEEAFRTTPGVMSTAVGFMGGTLDNPSYKAVCGGDTGHAETTEVVFDPEKILYETLLEMFWKMHDPTQVDRQGPDYGSQYRSAIFTTTPEQETKAIASKEGEQKNGGHVAPIATVIQPASMFWKAEDYHQQYFLKNGGGTCHI